MTIRGDRIRELRQAKNMSLMQLAQLVGAHWTTIAGLERQENEVSVKKFVAIVKALSADSNYLLGFTDKPN